MNQTNQAPVFTMLGDSAAVVCEGDVCALPDPVAASDAPEGEEPQETENRPPHG